MTGLHYQLIRL